jgi:hypothetical protein
MSPPTNGEAVGILFEPTAGRRIELARADVVVAVTRAGSLEEILPFQGLGWDNRVPVGTQDGDVAVGAIVIALLNAVPLKR